MKIKTFLMLVTACVGLSPVSGFAAFDQTSCNTIADQILQATHYKNTAQNAQMHNVPSVLVPVGHFSTFMPPSDALIVSQERISVLKQLSSRLGCSL